MISLDKMENGLYLVSDTEYTPDRYPVILNFLDKEDLEILDYSICLNKKVSEITLGGFNIYPLDFKEDFSKVLEELNNSYQEMKSDGDAEGLAFELKILCRTRPFNISRLFDDRDTKKLLEDIRHHLVSTDNLVVCDDESLLDESDKFWLLDNKKYIELLDEKLE